MPSAIERYIEAVRAGALPKPTRCSICAKSGCLAWHGTYTRTLITLTRTWIIPVKRLYCRLCVRTYAVLPSFVVKFHRYAREAIATAIRRLRSATFAEVVELFLERGGRHVAPLTLYFWRRKFA